ncbi:MAG: DNA repair protein RadC [Acidobacteriota bacterium]
MRVSELPEDERPREKLLAKGAAALSEAELLAILLCTGTRDSPVLEFARDWLTEAGGLQGLMALDVYQLRQRPGIGDAKATALAAALELGRRLAHAQLGGRALFDRPELAAAYLRAAHAAAGVEVFGCLTLDGRNRLIRSHELHRGARGHADVEPAEVFRAAIADNAAGVILWHTHPSGDPAPSEDDVALTRRLVEAGRLMHVSVLDHLVIAREGFVSLRQRGVIAAG